MAKSKHRKKLDPRIQEIASLEKVIHKLQKSLHWDVKIYVGGNKCEVLSSETEKCHQIKIPKKSHSIGLDMLHELCHAFLAETMHPAFSIITFVAGTQKEHVISTAWVFKLATDWFVDEAVFSLAPEYFRKELQEDFDLINRSPHGLSQMDPDLFNGIVLVIAQSIRYLHYQVEDNGICAEIVRICLASDPHQPTIENLTALVNRILKSLGEVTGDVLQVENQFDGEIHAWKFL